MGNPVSYEGEVLVSSHLPSQEHKLQQRCWALLEYKCLAFLKLLGPAFILLHFPKPLTPYAMPRKRDPNLSANAVGANQHRAHALSKTFYLQIVY